MKISDAIKQTGYSLSFEFFPPKTKADENRLFGVACRLESFFPTFVSVTYGAGGGTSKTTREVVKRIHEETSLTLMPHLTCIGQVEDELRGILRDYREMGVENILALRGDPPQGMVITPGHNGRCHARNLIEIVKSFNVFSIGVAVYPEGHSESPSLEKDIAYTKEKIDAGADFAITQMFFDNRYFYQFMERAEQAGIRIPVIPGIMPVTDIEKIKRFSGLCGATLPKDLIVRMERATSKQDEVKIGINFAIEQCQDLIENGVRYLHFYTLNNADIVSEILRGLNLDAGSLSQSDTESAGDLIAFAD